MQRPCSFVFLICLVLHLFLPWAQARRGPRDATVLIIRHAEKAEDKNDPGLSRLGWKRAEAYPDYFRHFTLDGAPIHIDYLFASRQTPQSVRPQLTLKPLSDALHIPMKLMFEDERYRNLARDLITGEFDHKTTLICWHHAKIAELIHELGGDAEALLGPNEWDEEVYGWVVVLRFGPLGEIKESYVINENLMPDDTKEPPAPPEPGADAEPLKKPKKK
jgi:hypothetical protein